MSTVASPAVGAGISVAGWGRALPERRVTNEDLTARLDTSDEWIVERTGIRERRVAGPGETTAPLATRAAREALARAGLAPTDLDVVIVATTTPETPIPSTASQVASALGVPAGGFDLNAACAGFVSALTAAAGLLSVGSARTLLLVGAETMTSVIDPQDRGTAILFGDGAAALVLTAGESTAGTGALTASAVEGAPGLVACDMLHDPAGVELLIVRAGGAARPASAETVAEGGHYLHMEGREVFRRAVRGVTESVQRTLARAGCSPDDVALFVPHQANARIVDSVLPRLGIPAERTLSTIDRYGNTSAASVPLSLVEVADSGRLAQGDLVLMCGFGAGMAISTVLWRWGVTPAATGGTHPVDSELAAGTAGPAREDAA